MKKYVFLFLVAVMALIQSGFSQVVLSSQSVKIDYSKPKEYRLGGVTVEGVTNLDQNALVLLTGLKIGETIQIPGDAITSAVKKLWKQGLFSDVQIVVDRAQGKDIFLVIILAEQPRLSRFTFKGAKKGDVDDLREKIDLHKEKIVTKSLAVTTKNKIKNFYVDKGFIKADVDIHVINDSVVPNHVMMVIDVNRGKKVKINDIIIEGNTAFSDAKVRRQMKETKVTPVFKPFDEFPSFVFNVVKYSATLQSVKLKDYLAEWAEPRMRLNFFKQSKYLIENFDGDKDKIIAKYNDKGYRDASIVSDSLYYINDHQLNLVVNVEEGDRYYFRNVKWVGNSKYSTQYLDSILNLKPGTPYSPSLLESKLFMNQNNTDITSIYMDDGYLFFQLDPVEVLVGNDSIDLEIRMREGTQARIKRIIVSGNTRTNDHVIIREIRTKPGQLFSRSDIIRTQRELAQLGYFDPEQLKVNPSPNPSDGTVDITYEVAERSSDQIELSGGWGGNMIVGNLGLTFNNFSTKNFFKKGSWSPLPSGDGQKLSIRGSTTGKQYQSLNFSFTEPWLGGKKPNAFSISTSYTLLSNGVTKFLTDTLNQFGEKVFSPTYQQMKIARFGLGLGKRLNWPDNYFQLYQELALENYQMNNYQAFTLTDGTANNMYYNLILTRSSVDAPIYARSGSSLTFNAQLTPPYSMFSSRDYSTLTLQEKFKWTEYYKWKFTSAWYTSLVGDLVLYTKAGFGFLGQYNKQVGVAPFERFYLGGSGLTGFSLDGREIIALRGYDDQSVSPSTGGTMITKYTAELRYPVSLNPSATIFGLAFAEAGNTWNSFKGFDPFALKRSAGVGIRVYLPMFGLLGLDWGYRFDDIPGRSGMQKSQVHFTIGANLGEL